MLCHLTLCIGGLTSAKLSLLVFANREVHTMQLFLGNASAFVCLGELRVKRFHLVTQLRYFGGDVARGSGRDARRYHEGSIGAS